MVFKFDVVGSVFGLVLILVDCFCVRRVDCIGFGRVLIVFCSILYMVLLFFRRIGYYVVSFVYKGFLDMLLIVNGF